MTFLSWRCKVKFSPLEKGLSLPPNIHQCIINSLNCSPWLHEASYNRLGFYIWPSTQGPWTVKLLMSNVLIYWAICDTLSIFELFWVIIFKNTFHFIWHICLPNQLFWIIDFSRHLFFAAIVNSDSPLYLYSDTRTGRG